jgi:phosphoglycerate kinase
MMGISKKTIREIEFAGKRVIMRVDFNVPLKDGVIQDDTRIAAALPSIKYILDSKAKSLVLMSHLGDPAKDAAKAREKAEKDGKPFDEEIHRRQMQDVACRRTPFKAAWEAGCAGA